MMKVKHLRWPSRQSTMMGRCQRSAMFDQILVAVDQSNQAQAALRAGIELAKLLGAYLTAIHVNRAGESDEAKATIDVKGPRLLRRLSKLPNVTAICRTGQPVAEIVA